MSRRRFGGSCCCGKACILLSDNFDRAPSTNLGANWEEVSGSGDSSIVGGELSMPAGAMVVTTEGTGLPDPWMTSTAVIPNPQPGDIDRAIVNYVDTNNYLCAEVEFQAAGVAVIRACSISAGAKSVLDENTVGYVAGEANSIVACRTIEGLYAGCNASMTTWACVGDNGGRKAGLENASASNTITLDTFVSLRGEGLNGLGADPDVVSRCFYCECECEGHCLPDTLTLHIDSSGFCSCFDDWEITLTLDMTHQPEVCWSGSGVIGSWDGCSGSATAYFVLICDEAQGAFYLLNNIWPDVNGWTDRTATYSAWVGGGNAGGKAPTSIICDPFELFYSGFIQTGSPPPDDPTCVFTITITE